MLPYLKKALDRFVMIWGIFMLLGLTFMDNFRSEMAEIVGSILAPITVLPIHWAILVLALITGVITAVIQKYTMNNEGLRETQKRMKDVQSRLKEARLEKDQKKLKELESEQKEMMGDFLGMQKQMLKPMFYIMAITIPIFAWIYLVTTDPAHTHVFAHGGETPTGLLVPLFGEISFTEQLIVVPGGIVWYILCSIPLSQVVRKFLNVRMGA